MNYELRYFLHFRSARVHNRLAAPSHGDIILPQRSAISVFLLKVHKRMGKKSSCSTFGGILSYSSAVIR